MYIISIGYPEFCWPFKYIYIYLFLIIKILKSKQKSIPIQTKNNCFLGIYQ